MGHSQKAAAFERQKKQQELTKLLARDQELDRLFNRMYEDNISGKIDDERFSRMSRSYTEEQNDLAVKVKALRSELESAEEKACTSDMFIAAVRKYTRAKKLTGRMLTELIDRIEVHQSEKMDGVSMQRLTIYYNCVGVIEIPEKLQLPQPEVFMQTRKGVALSYSHSQNSMNF